MNVFNILWNLFKSGSNGGFWFVRKLGISQNIEQKRKRLNVRQEGLNQYDQ